MQVYSICGEGLGTNIQPQKIWKILVTVDCGRLYTPCQQEIDLQKEGSGRKNLKIGFVWGGWGKKIKYKGRVEQEVSNAFEGMEYFK